MIIETSPQKSKRGHAMPEGRIQATCYQYFWNNYPQYRGLYFAVPNENSRADSNAISGGRRRAMGVFHGVSDTLLLIPRGVYHGLCIEYKDEKGRQSEYQKEWQKKVEAQGYRYEVVRTLPDFQSLINDYLSL